MSVTKRRLDAVESLQANRARLQALRAKASVLEERHGTERATRIAALDDTRSQAAARLQASRRALQRLSPEALDLDRQRLDRSIANLQAAGMAVLYTTHYMEEAQRLCDRIGIIDEGRLVAEGTQSELISAVGQSPVVRLTASGDLRTLARHGIGQNAAATTHIQRFCARQWGQLGDPIQTQGVDLVQGPKLALWVPPAVGQI
jgi:hypothetical protein